MFVSVLECAFVCVFIATSVVNKDEYKDPSTKTSISSKRRNNFFQRLLRRKFATERTSFLQCYEGLRKWCDFCF